MSLRAASRACGIGVRHGLSASGWLAANQWPRKLHPVAARAGDLERVQQKIVGRNHAMAGNFEGRLGLAVRAGKQDVHHARSCAAREKTLHRRRHDLGFGLARLVGVDQRPEAVDDDVHGVAHFGEFFFALNRARHIELAIEGNEFE